MKLRVGDEIRFWRGSNTYTGKVVALDPLLKGCTVVTGVTNRQGVASPWHVGIANIVRVEKPVMTGKEATVVRLLDREKRPMTMAEMRATGYKLNSRTLGTLAERGLVVAKREGVVATGAPMWALTRPDGLRAASQLRV